MELFQVCRHILKYTREHLKTVLFYYFSLIYDFSVPPNVLNNLVCRELKKVENHWPREPHRPSLEKSQTLICNSLFCRYFFNFKILRKYSIAANSSNLLAKTKTLAKLVVIYLFLHCVSMPPTCDTLRINFFVPYVKHSGLKQAAQERGKSQFFRLEYTSKKSSHHVS